MESRAEHRSPHDARTREQRTHGRARGAHTCETRDTWSHTFVTRPRAATSSPHRQKQVVHRSADRELYAYASITPSQIARSNKSTQVWCSTPPATARHPHQHHFTITGAKATTRNSTSASHATHRPPLDSGARARAWQTSACALRASLQAISRPSVSDTTPPDPQETNETSGLTINTLG